MHHGKTSVRYSLEKGMKTTLNEIRKHSPCSDGWGNLLLSLDKTQPDDEDLDLMYILKSNGIQDAVWALRCFDYLDYCLFLADVAESVLCIFEKNNDSKAPRLTIQAIRDYKGGGITKERLLSTAYAAYAAYADVAYYAADAADAAYAAYSAAYAADAASAAAYSRKSKWQEIERLFIKHFGGEV